MAKKKQASEFSDTDLWSLINYSTHDYIAARTLLREGLPGAGTTMAITAIEKMMKVILLKHGHEIVVGGSGHRLKPMLDNLKALDPTLFTSDQEIFIEHIDKAYKIRYPDNIDPDFRIFLPSLKILENLDVLYCGLMEREPLISISLNGRYFDMFFRGGAKKELLTTCNAHYQVSLRGSLSSNNQKCTAYSANKSGSSYMEWYKSSNKVKADNDWREPDGFNKW